MRKYLAVDKEVEKKGAGVGNARYGGGDRTFRSPLQQVVSL